MNIYGSLMDIFDEKKTKTFMSKQCGSPTPKGVYLWTFKNNNS